MSDNDNMRPTVFLDIDGVLNSANFFINTSSIDRKDPRSQLDPKAIEYLNEIAHWRFVLSSTWRKFYSIDRINSMLIDMGFKGKIESYTPELNSKGSLRGNEIYVWQNEHGSANDNYIIFDDDSDMLYWQRNNFIHIDNHFGLSPNHIYKAKLLLNQK